MTLSQAWKAIPIFLIVVVLFIPTAEAQEKPFDVTECLAVTITLVSDFKEFMVFSVDAKGTVFSHHENKAFDNCSLHVVGINKIAAGKRIANNYFKLIDPDGDAVIGEITVTGLEKSINFFYGTGKWKGIKGGGKGKEIARPRPIAPGTAQSCTRYTGTFELGK